MTTLSGNLHPITLYLRRAMATFKALGFTVLDSPEVTTERHNFDDLLVPANHPARSMQDTFWLTDGRLPRTHTSAFQIPAMKDHTPPVRFIVPGRVFRNEATDATHETTFYQLEGFVIDKDTTLAELKWTLLKFIEEMYGSDIQTRIVPSYFPFVQPGIEISIYLNGRWLEILGAGMIHPGVLKNMGLNPEEWQGYAFGLGIDRLAMLAYGITDVRELYSGNLRLLTQFRQERA